MRSPPANEIYSAARVCEFLRQEYETPFTIFGQIDTRSCGAHSMIPEQSHALEHEAAVLTRRCRRSRMHLTVPWSCGAHSVIPEQSHALKHEAAVRTRRCRRSRTRLMVTWSCGALSVIPELSHALEVEAVVRNRRSRSSRTRLMVPWSCGAHSVIPEQSHALEHEAAVRTRRCRRSRTRLLSLWPSYALGGAAVRAYCCCDRHTRLVEQLLCTPVVAVVHTRWSCCACLIADD